MLRTSRHTRQADTALLGTAHVDSTDLAASLTARAEALRTVNPTPERVVAPEPVGPRIGSVEEFSAAVAEEAFAAGMTVDEYEQLVESFQQTGQPLPPENVCSRLRVADAERTSTLAQVEPRLADNDTPAATAHVDGPRVVSVQVLPAVVAEAGAAAGVTVDEYEQLVESFQQTGQPFPTEHVHSRLCIATDQDTPAPTATFAEHAPAASERRPGQHPALRPDPAVPAPPDQTPRRGLTR